MIFLESLLFLKENFMKTFFSALVLLLLSSAQAQTFNNDFSPVVTFPGTGQPGNFPSPFPIPRTVPKRAIHEFLNSQLRANSVEAIEAKWDVHCFRNTEKVSPYGFDNLQYNIQCSGEKVDLTYRLVSGFWVRGFRGPYQFSFVKGKVFYRWK